jgi:hypothetical protein
VVLDLRAAHLESGDRLLPSRVQELEPCRGLDSGSSDFGGAFCLRSSARAGTLDSRYPLHDSSEAHNPFYFRGSVTNRRRITQAECRICGGDCWPTTLQNLVEQHVLAAGKRTFVVAENGQSLGILRPLAALPRIAALLPSPMRLLARSSGLNNQSLFRRTDGLVPGEPLRMMPH